MVVATAEAGRPREAPCTTRQEVSGRSVVGDIIIAAFPRARRGHAVQLHQGQGGSTPEADEHGVCYLGSTCLGA